MTSSSNLRQGSIWTDKLFEMINQEFKTQRTKFQVLPNFGVCCRELGGSKLRVFVHACMKIKLNRSSYCYIVSEPASSFFQNYDFLSSFSPHLRYHQPESVINLIKNFRPVLNSEMKLFYVIYCTEETIRPILANKILHLSYDDNYFQEI